MQFNNKGIPKVDPGDLRIANLDSITFGAGKVNILNKDDSLLYTLCVQNIAGQAVPYLFRGGNARVVDGVYQVKNDNDGLWYPLGVENQAGQPVIYLGAGVV